jgi:hypothetical protein
MSTASFRGEGAMNELIDSANREYAVLTESGTDKNSTLRVGVFHATQYEPKARSIAKAIEFVSSDCPAVAPMPLTADLGLPGAVFTVRAYTTMVLIERSRPPDSSQMTGVSGALAS